MSLNRSLDVRLRLISMLRLGIRRSIFHRRAFVPLFESFRSSHTLHPSVVIRFRVLYNFLFPLLIHTYYKYAINHLASSPGLEEAWTLTGAINSAL